MFEYFQPAIATDLKCAAKIREVCRSFGQFNRFLDW